MFNSYNPMQYLAIDIANHFGKDKLTYEDRISWVKENLDNLEELSHKAETPFLYNKAVRALRDTQAGKATGHTVALDSVCSGMQIMSAIMGCRKGCSITGLIHQDVRSDAYTEITSYMSNISPVSVDRTDAKQAVMTSLYGSKAVPKEVFGDELLELFYITMNQMAPGAMQLLELLRSAWNPDADYHTWALPDAHMAVVPVSIVEEKRINISEIGYTPVVLVDTIGPQDKGISLIANVVHSIDGYVLRTLVRRCSYDKTAFTKAKAVLSKAESYTQQDLEEVRRWEHSGIADLVDVKLITKERVQAYPLEMREQLLRMINMSLETEPFDIICVHDSFAVHPNHANHLRRTYADILATLCESTIVEDILNQLYGDEDTVEKFTSDISGLAQEIRESNYGIC